MVESFHVGNSVYPRKCGTPPDLSPADQLSALRNYAKSNPDDRWIIDGPSIDPRTAISAESRNAFAAGFLCRFFVILRLPAQQLELIAIHTDSSAESCTAHYLAISAVAGAKDVRRNFRLEFYCPAVTLTVDLHVSYFGHPGLKLGHVVASVDEASFATLKEQLRPSALSPAAYAALVALMQHTTRAAAIISIVNLMLRSFPRAGATSCFRLHHITKRPPADFHKSARSLHKNYACIAQTGP